MGKKKYTEIPHYKYLGDWAWNDKILWSHVEASLDIRDCWLWHGSMSPTGALFGARKNGYPQMTQARRLVWASHNNQDPSPYSMTLTCHNQQCVSPFHIELKENNRLPFWRR